jgi:hypothetical protein
MISYQEFFIRIKEMPATIYSKSKHVAYTEFRIEGDTLHFVRVSTGKHWPLDIPHLYSIYKNNNFINTSVVRRIKNARVNSPSIAVLMAIACIDKDGDRID